MRVALCLVLIAVAAAMLAAGAWCASHDWIVPATFLGAAGGLAVTLVLVVAFDPKDP